MEANLNTWGKLDKVVRETSVKDTGGKYKHPKGDQLKLIDFLVSLGYYSALKESILDISVWLWLVQGR